MFLRAVPFGLSNSSCTSSVFPAVAMVWLIVLGLGFGLLSTSWGFADPPVDSPRYTPLVRVIQKIEPAVVALFTPVDNQIFSGSGTVIHPDGYVLTNNHVLPKTEGFALMQGAKPLQFRVVSRMPEADIAILRLVNPPTNLATVPIGRSHDLMHGESVVVAGNPGGRGIVFTAGIVSANNVLEGGPNAMIMSNYVNDRRDRLIQFDAASNRGNSGGPLVNMEGRVIGVVAAVINGEQNVGLAIPIDRVRQSMESLLESEMVHESTLGLRLDPLAESAVVREVVPDSPADLAGLHPGDEIVSLDGKSLHHAIDWQLGLETRLPARKLLRMETKEGDRLKTVELQPSNYKTTEVADILGTQPGLKYMMCEGKFNEMPDFDELTANRQGVSEDLEVDLVAKDRKDYFAIQFDGFLRVDKDDLYRLIIVSDDGSKLYLDGRLLIDHDGNHPPKPAGQLVRLRKGLHPIRIEYFQGNGEKSLQLFMDPCPSRASLSLTPPTKVPKEALSHIP